MGRAKAKAEATAPVTTPAAAAVAEEQKKTNKDYVTEAFKALGKDASGTEVYNWLKEQYPKEEFNENTIKATSSTVRTGGTKTAKADKPAANSGPTPDQYLAAITTANGLIANAVSVETINEVASLIDTLGSAENVKKLFDALTNKPRK